MNHSSATGSRFVAGLLSATVLIISGCSEQPNVAPVRGTVTLDGVPLTAGRVMFEPIASGDQKLAGPAAFADIAADGSYVLSTFGDNDGAVAGPHHPTVMGPRQDEQETPIQTMRLGVVRLQSVTFNVQPDADNVFDIQIDSRSPEFQQAIADD